MEALMRAMRMRRMSRVVLRRYEKDTFCGFMGVLGAVGIS